MNTSHKIIFFGTEIFSLTSLKALVNAGFTVAAVVTKPDQPKGRGHRLTPPPIKTFALEHGIPVWQPAKLADIIDSVKALQPVAGVLVSYGKIIPGSIIDLFTPGIINVHPSLLPLYRGPTPIESAILHGDTETGVSIMQLSPAMDAGPVYTQAHHSLTGHETQASLYESLGIIGSKLLVDTLPRILDGTLRPVAQDETAATYCSLLSKKDAFFEPAHLSAEAVERKIRAHAVFPKTKLVFGNHTIIITKAHTTTQKESPLDIECQTGVLAIDEVIAPSGKTMTASDFLRGYAA